MSYLTVIWLLHKSNYSLYLSFYRFNFGFLCYSRFISVNHWEEAVRFSVWMALAVAALEGPHVVYGISTFSYFILHILHKFTMVCVMLLVMIYFKYWGQFSDWNRDEMDMLYSYTERYYGECAKFNHHANELAFERKKRIFDFGLIFTPARAFEIVCFLKYQKETTDQMNLTE